MQMNIKTIAKGISIGTTVGTAAFMLMNSAEKKKRSFKRKAAKMMKSASDMLDDITSAMK